MSRRTIRQPMSPEHGQYPAKVPPVVFGNCFRSGIFPSGKYSDVFRALPGKVPAAGGGFLIYDRDRRDVAMIFPIKKVLTLSPRWSILLPKGDNCITFTCPACRAIIIFRQAKNLMLPFPLLPHYPLRRRHGIFNPASRRQRGAP